ncbi:hypothetical protein [Kibdelosporangium phytohabitans]|nr:hypothetical protein [Kibdelosporangium phytohabitans]MBE1463673.1 hypothetical protein [Kibdelosporangium phytohabitans]
MRTRTIRRLEAGDFATTRVQAAQQLAEPRRDVLRCSTLSSPLSG